MKSRPRVTVPVMLVALSSCLRRLHVAHTQWGDSVTGLLDPERRLPSSQRLSGQHEVLGQVSACVSKLYSPSAPPEACLCVMEHHARWQRAWGSGYVQASKVALVLAPDAVHAANGAFLRRRPVPGGLS